MVIISFREIFCCPLFFSKDSPLDLIRKAKVNLLPGYFSFFIAHLKKQTNKTTKLKGLFCLAQQNILPWVLTAMHVVLKNRLAGLPVFEKKTRVSPWDLPPGRKKMMVGLMGY